MDEPRPTTNLTDADLIRRVAEGEAEALELLYDRSAWFVYANAFRMLHDRSRAQALVPQVYLSLLQWQSSYKSFLWRNHAGYRVGRTWLTSQLLALTYSIAFDHFPDLSYIPESRFADNLDVPRDIHKGEVRQATLRVFVAEAMDWLPASQRHVFHLRAVQGLNAKLVAERIEKSPDAVDALMYRAVRNIQYSIGLEPEEITQLVALTEEEQERLRLAKDNLITEIEDLLRRSRSETLPHPVFEKQQPSFAETVEYLQAILGLRLTALIAGTQDAREIINWASSDAHPNTEVEQRLRGAFEIVQLLLKVESPSAVRSWFLGMNPELDDRAPALALADEPEIVAEAARNFAAAG